MFADIVQVTGEAVEALGITVLLLGVVYATVRYLRDLRAASSYQAYRRRLGRSILLGLELLVAGDIIRTVTTDLSLESVAALAIVVIIRTFLTFSIELEIEGRLPWRASDRS